MKMCSVHQCKEIYYRLAEEKPVCAKHWWRWWRNGDFKLHSAIPRRKIVDLKRKGADLRDIIRKTGASTTTIRNVLRDEARKLIS